MPETNAKLARADLALSICWIGLDASWMLKLNALALFFVPLTLACSVLTFVYTEKETDALCVTAAMTAWALMCCTWFVSDVGYWAGGLAVAKGCLLLCLGLLAFVGFRSRMAKETAIAALARFKRLRLQRR